MPKVTQARPLRQGSFDEDAARRREQDLTSVTSGRDARRAMDIEADVPVPTKPALAGMDADSHSYGVAIGPGLLCQPLLHGHGRGNGARR